VRQLSLRVSTVSLCFALLFHLPGHLVAQGSPLPPTPADTSNYQVVQVARGVYAFIAPPGITPMVSGNSTVVIGDSGVLVIDSGQFPSVARWEIARIKALTSLPVRYLINTHWHPDHWLGNSEFRAAWPDVVIVSTTITRALMESKGSSLVDPKAAVATQQALKGMLSAGKQRNGTPIPDGTMLWYQYALAELEALAPQLEGFTLTYPTDFVRDKTTFHLGRRSVRVAFLGRGNTEGDLIAYIPDTKTLVTGDLVVQPYPYVFGSFLGEWIDGMKRLAGFHAAAIIPGHGAVERDNRYLTEVSALLQSLERQARAAVGKGVSLEAAAKSVDLAAFRQRMCADASPYCIFGFESSMVAGFARAYREAKEGKLPDEK
jgi:glyoxylase-like metal-dependent hydrolase (beta-lactamase superfamily II)